MEPVRNRLGADLLFASGDAAESDPAGLDTLANAGLWSAGTGGRHMMTIFPSLFVAPGAPAWITRSAVSLESETPFVTSVCVASRKSRQACTE